MRIIRSGKESLQCQIFVCALWAIWTERNKWIPERQRKTGLKVADFVRNYICELDGLRNVLLAKMMERERWKPPENPFVKINFDSAYKKDENRSCSGIVIKDSDGRVLGSRIVLNKNVLLVFEVDALVCVKGFQLGLDSRVMAVEV
ncbi:hypothetical protein PVK06_019291 [Gossypium arboreum]|uniref:RNase H type-1 domain-containing protein n=1 Tax=Gossypium arboreum TaxID=29729 RepID=A0ABR0PJN3_GOSAR|nr:hypothetical protein PVK06_019291 [Gossypium arboreum]